MNLGLPSQVNTHNVLAIMMSEPDDQVKVVTTIS